MSDLLRKIRSMADHFDHVGQILLEGGRRILREPFRRQSFRGETNARAAARGDARSHEQMRNVSQARDPIAEWKACPRRQHEELERREREQVSHAYLARVRGTNRARSPARRASDRPPSA